MEKCKFNQNAIVLQETATNYGGKEAKCIL